MPQAIVVSTHREAVESKPVTEVRLDTGGNAVTADHFDGAGEDALPLPGDVAEYGYGAPAGSLEIIGYHDPKNQGLAGPGEKRIYARNPNSGTIVCQILLGSGGAINIDGLVNGGTAVLDPSDGSWTINGVRIDKQGNITTPGEVMAMSTGPGTGVKLSTHVHPTGTGPSGPPTTGT